MVFDYASSSRSRRNIYTSITPGQNLKNVFLRFLYLLLITNNGFTNVYEFAWLSRNPHLLQLAVYCLVWLGLALLALVLELLCKLQRFICG